MKGKYMVAHKGGPTWYALSKLAQTVSCCCSPATAIQTQAAFEPGNIMTAVDLSTMQMMGKTLFPRKYCKQMASSRPEKWARVKVPLPLPFKP